MAATMMVGASNSGIGEEEKPGMRVTSTSAQPKGEPSENGDVVGLPVARAYSSTFAPGPS